MTNDTLTISQPNTLKQNPITSPKCHYVSNVKMSFSTFDMPICGTRTSVSKTLHPINPTLIVWGIANPNKSVSRCVGFACLTAGHDFENRWIKLNQAKNPALLFLGFVIPYCSYRLISPIRLIRPIRHLFLTTKIISTYPHINKKNIWTLLHLLSSLKHHPSANFSPLKYFSSPLKVFV